MLSEAWVRSTRQAKVGRSLCNDNRTFPTIHLDHILCQRMESIDFDPLSSFCIVERHGQVACCSDHNGFVVKVAGSTTATGPPIGLCRCRK
jgi:hypothetical protein